MKKALRLILMAGVFGLVLVVGTTLAREFQEEKGFVRLDNGKNLDGWKGNTAGWSVQEGAIHLDSKNAKGNIYTEKLHGPTCVIRLQFKATKGADSGVFIHGKQLQVRDYPNAGPKQYAKPAKAAGEWNDLEFDIKDGVAVVKLNGQVIEKAWRVGSNPKQGIGLQRERGDFDFRNIRIMEKK